MDKKAVHQCQVIHVEEQIWDKDLKISQPLFYAIFFVEHVVYASGDKSESEIVNGM